MQNIDFAFQPALEQAKRIRQKEISPLELLDFYLERIERYDPQIGSHFAVMSELARSDAKAKTEQLAATNDLASLPPFFGVPIPIKDLNAVAQMPCSAGVASLQDQIPEHEDGMVTKLREAGFVLLGKTATSQLGSLPYTEPEGFPPTRNPWNLERTPGGSSGGAAAAVAAGLSPVAQGSDGGGSIRIPSACCGLVGIKPSRGRVSSAPVGDRLHGMATDGPIARTVADAAALLDAMSGYICGDPYWLGKPNPSFLEATRQATGSVRIAYATSFSGLPPADATAKQAVLDTTQRLCELGHEATEACPNFEGLVEPFTTIFAAAVSSAGIPPSALDPINRMFFQKGEQITAGEYLQSIQHIQILSRQIVGFFQDIDVLVLPVLLHPPIRVGEWSQLSLEQTLDNITRWIASCPPFNATGQPAIAVPVGFDDNGLPVSVQLIGKPAAESTLISLASQLEAVYCWHYQYPEAFVE